MRSLVVCLALVGLCSLPAAATAVTYDIFFTGESVMGSPLPSGSFTYDPSSGYSGFIVNWNGVAFDLTSSANAPMLATDPQTDCDSAASDHQYGFILMSQTATGCTAQAQYAWAGLHYGGSASQFFFILNVTNGLSAPQDEIGGMVVSEVPSSPLMDYGAGGWTISPAGSVPEPGTFAMCLAALLLPGIARARWFHPSR